MTLPPPCRRTSQGFNLIELMIAMALGLLLIAAIGSMFVGSHRSYHQDEAATRMQDELRYALAQITRDLEMAGHWTEVWDPSRVKKHADLKIVTDCGPSMEVYEGLDQSVVVGDNVGDIATTFSCIDADGFKKDTDVLALRRVAGRTTAAASLNAGNAYMQSNGTDGVLAIAPVSSGGVDPPAAPKIIEYFEYQPSVYYIRDYTATPGDGVPSLCREYLSSVGNTPTMETECLFSGIENLQVEVGIDTNNDGVPNSFISAPTAAQLVQASALRISLLARSENPAVGYTNEKTYTLGNLAPLSPADRYYRRTASMVVTLRNPAALRQLQ